MIIRGKLNHSVKNIIIPHKLNSGAKSFLKYKGYMARHIVLS